MCHKQYSRATQRTVGQRFNEHTDGIHPSSVVQEHIDLTSQPVTSDHVRMLCKEDETRRKVKEAIEIYKDGPSLNRDHGCEIPPPSLAMWNSQPLHLAIKSL